MEKTVSFQLVYVSKIDTSSSAASCAVFLRKEAFLSVIRLRSALSPSSLQKRMAGSQAGGSYD